jgi:hypothetical protein
MQHARVAVENKKKYVKEILVTKNFINKFSI